jgi:hypothetical protein
MKQFLLGHKMKLAFHPGSNQRGIPVADVIGAENYRTFFRNMFGSNYLPSEKHGKYLAE